MIMPLAGFTLSYIFKLPAELAVGVILVGCCPGGTSSNVMTFMVKIVGFVIDANSENLFANGVVIIAVVILHNCCGYLMGFLIGKVIKMPMAKRNAIAIEVGMQNSGMATTLAASCFPTLALATVPGAIFSAWYNISGAIAANLMAYAYDNEQKKLNKE